MAPRPPRAIRKMKKRGEAPSGDWDGLVAVRRRIEGWGGASEAVAADSVARGQPASVPGKQRAEDE